ncbi:MAG: hypothetical protein Q9179_002470 [Wetmoreana sp. 5 TL-2023]
MTSYLKSRAPTGAFDFFTYSELIYWVIFCVAINPFRWKWAPFVFLGIGSALPKDIVYREDQIRNGLDDSSVSEIPRIIRLLTQSQPSTQRATVETYFTPSASFTHPFCRTGSFEGSRWLIWCIYRWYKILSPRIDFDIGGVAFDEKNLTLYVNIHQVFRIWVIPFYNAPVSFVTVLKLVRYPPLPPQPSYSTPINPNDAQNGTIYKASSEKPLFYIQSQKDLYQVNEFFKFFSQFGILSGLLLLWQFLSTAICVVGALVFWPVSWVEQNVIGGNKERSIGDAVIG